MNSFQWLLQSVSFRFNKSVLKYCEKLFSNFNLNDFWYYTISNSGVFSYFGSHPGFDEYFVSEGLYLDYPYFRHPKYFRDGVVLMETVHNPTISKLVGKGKEFNFQHPMHIVSKLPDGMEIYGFSSASHDAQQLAMLLVEMPLLKLFVKKFKEDNSVIFSLLKDNEIDLGKIKGAAFTVEYKPEMLQLSSREQFLKEMDMPDPYLSAREAEVLKYLLKGNSASQTGKLLHLSKRTIEHHVERIKGKLSCDSKAELTQKARELELYGVLR